MNVDLPADQQSFINNLVASGRYSSAHEAISEGVRLLASTERLKQQVEIGMEEADRGDLVDHETVFNQLRTMAMQVDAGQ